ncbi:hypothetical protein AGMMS50293_17170 [Spirochaetia bacterium]|nr:hypothetical protein AGMMS50293_17170 [Spirochaetia bacterium]
MAHFSHNIPGMDETRLTRPWLESLSTEELVKLADNFGVDIPFGLERIFIIEELLELALEDEYGPGNDLGVHPDFLEAAALPKQYNISYIEVMIRDPLWVFVFWEIKGHDRELYEKAPDFEGYCLRVIPLEGEAERADSFTVTVGVDDTAWYLGFPPAEGRYQVEFCALRGETETALTVSRPFKLPSLIEPPGRKAGVPKDIQDMYHNPLVCLSGVQDFSVIRSADRQSRAKGL